MNSTSEALQRLDIQQLFELQKANQWSVGKTTAKQRKDKLKALKNAVEYDFRQALRDALMADFRKPKAEVDLSEIFPVTSEIKFILSKLDNWLSVQRVPTPMAFLGSSSHIRYQPKGVCLIISPWNFPVNLSFNPLASAIAAGNTAILKPSEHTPNTSGVIRSIVEQLFKPSEVAVVEGGVETATLLLERPFNHVFFTGSPAVGKIVMQAASRHLTSVSLELGGKSPVIVDATANIDVAARRIVWGKFFNSGQICIAPDYIYVDETRKTALVEAIKRTLETFYGKDVKTSDSFARMVSVRHAERVESYLVEALAKGAKVLHGGKIDAAKSYIEPTLVENLTADCALMQQEIFAPILPILTFKNIDEVITNVNAGEKPLALYIYSKNEGNIERLLHETRAGGSCVNHNDVHFYNPHLPFGGSNHSGIGKTHGFHGFQAFSEARAVYRQHLPSALELLSPPYTKFKERLVEFVVKFF